MNEPRITQLHAEDVERTLEIWEMAWKDGHICARDAECIRAALKRNVAGAADLDLASAEIVAVQRRGPWSRNARRYRRERAAFHTNVRHLFTDDDDEERPPAA